MVIIMLIISSALTHRGIAYIPVPCGSGVPLTTAVQTKKKSTTRPQLSMFIASMLSPQPHVYLQSRRTKDSKQRFLKGPREKENIVRLAIACIILRIIILCGVVLVRSSCPSERGGYGPCCGVGTIGSVSNQLPPGFFWGLGATGGGRLYGHRIFGCGFGLRGFTDSVTVCCLPSSHMFLATKPY